MAKKLKNKAYDHRIITKSSSRFLCCFGFKPHRKDSISTVDRSDDEHDHNHFDCDHHKKRRRSDNNKITVRLPFFKLGVKGNRTSVRTVPVLVDAVPEKPVREGKIVQYWSKSPKSKSKSTGDADQKPAIMISTAKVKNQPPTEIETVVSTAPDKNPKEKPGENNTNLENRKNTAQLNSNTSKDDTCTSRVSFTRKIDAIRTGTGSSQPGSPVPSKKADKTVRPFRHSESLPAGFYKTKPATSPRKPAGREEKEPVLARKRFEPLVGLSVVMVTLVIMLMWGRVCAILCTSAWLYFVPRLSTAVVDPSIRGLGNGSGSKELDLGSEESKKKVVFEGFLERNNNHRGL